MQFSVNDLRALAGAFDALAASADDVAEFCGEAVVVSLDGGLLRIEGVIDAGPLALLVGRAVPDVTAPQLVAVSVVDTQADLPAAPLAAKPSNFGPPWTEAERDVILKVARAQPDFGSFAIAEMVSKTLDRSQKAVDNYIRNNMRSSVLAARKAGIADRRAAEQAAFAPVKAPPAKGAVAKPASRQVAYLPAEDDRLVAWMIENPSASTYQCGRALCAELGRSERAIDMHMKKVLAGRIARERAAVAAALAAQKAVAVLSVKPAQDAPSAFIWSVVDEDSAAPASAAEVAAVGAGDAPAAVGPDVVADAVPLAAPVVQKVLAPSPGAVLPLSTTEVLDLEILTRLGQGEKTPIVAADMGLDTAYVSGRFLALVEPFKAKGYGPVDAQRKAIERLSARVQRP